LNRAQLHPLPEVDPASQGTAETVSAQHAAAAISAASLSSLSSWPEHFAAYQAELVETLETGSDPGAFWAKWIDVVVERTSPKDDEPKKTP